MKKKSVNQIKEAQGDKNRVFDLVFSSKQDWKLDMLADMLPKTFRRSERGRGYSFLTNVREYSFTIRGIARVNTLIAYFVTKMPRIKWKCYEKNEATEFMHSNRKTRTK